jgi:DNA-binding protein Alba
VVLAGKTTKHKNNDRSEVTIMSEQENNESKMDANIKSKADDNVIFVGRKPSMAYVLGVITQFNEGKKEVHIKARGKAISRAVDVAEIVRRKFVNDVHVKSIDIGTEERELEDKTKINVSAIDIVMGK